MSHFLSPKKPFKIFILELKNESNDVLRRIENIVLVIESFLIEPPTNVSLVQLLIR